MQRGIQKRIIQDVIVEMTGGKKGEIKLFPKDIRGNRGSLIVYLDDLGDLLHELEVETKEKIRLINPIALEILPSLSSDEIVEYNLFSGNGDYVNDHFYYLVGYDPDHKKIETKKLLLQPLTGVIRFTLTKNGDLYRDTDDHERQVYKMKPESYRYKMINALDNEFINTADLAKTVGYDNKLQTFMGQIAGIRNQIQKNFSIEGKYFIEESGNGSGYRLGKNIIIKKIHH